MAYNISAGSIIEVQYRYRLAGQQCINTFHYQTDVAIEPAQDVDSTVAENFYTSVGVHLQSYQTSDVTGIMIRAQWVASTRYAYAEYFPEDSVGGLLPPTLSIGTSIVFRRRSDNAARWAQGRFFLGGYSVDGTSVGELDQETVDNITTDILPHLRVNIATGVGDGEVKPVVWSPTSTHPNQYVVEVAVDRYLRYQRRREVGRGE